MTTTAERAGRWLRVSTAGQDEANQEPDINGWIADHGYEHNPATMTYQLHGKSASKGKQDKALGRVIEDMRRGHISVLVVWQSSRIEQRGAYSVFDLARRVKEAGGRIEYVQDAYLNETNDMSDVMLALAATKDKQKSQDISKQVKAAHDRIRKNHALLGRCPWGYTSEGDEYNRQMVATAAGEKYVPEVYQRVADGQTLVEVAAWLTGETVKTWHPRTVAAMIRNPTYRGEHREMVYETYQDAKTGAPKVRATGYGNTICKCPPLVSDKLWNRANANLDARPSGRRGQRNDLDPAGAAVLSGIAACGNPACTATGEGDSPMYRYGKSYRCSGTGPKRRGCGCTVPVPDADALLDRFIGGMLRPVLRPVFHPAEGHQVEIDDVLQALRDLPAQGLPRADEQAERERLWAEQDRLQAMPGKPARTDWVPVLDDNGTPLTYGAKWLASDQAARRTWLRDDAGFAISLGRPDMDVADMDDDQDLLARVDVEENARAVLVFKWLDDDDPGLARYLP